MDADRIFAALASAARRGMLAELAAGEATTTELARRFAVTTPAASRHLSLLENAGLVTSRREGQRVLYALVRDTLLEALSALAADLAPGVRPAAAGRAKPQREAL